MGLRVLVWMELISAAINSDGGASLVMPVGLGRRGSVRSGDVRPAVLFARFGWSRCFGPWCRRGRNVWLGCSARAEGNHVCEASESCDLQISENRKIFHTVNHSRIIWDPQSKPKGILGGHLNVRSLKSKADKIHLLLDSNLDFLCLTETWLNKNSPVSIVDVLGYNVFRKDKMGSKGGGVLIFMKDSIQCQEMVMVKQ